MVWLIATAAQLNSRYRIKLTTKQEFAELQSIEYRININTLEREKASALEMNEIGVVHLESARPLLFDPYIANRITGSFILIDPLTNATVAAGMVIGSYLQALVGPSREPAPVKDVEALHALAILLRRLGVSVPSAEKPERTGDYTI